jgi:serine/threonine-protein kinase
MGIVYLARDVQLDRDVAIKVLPTVLAQDPAARERFIREARTAAGLSHPHPTAASFSSCRPCSARWRLAP